MDNSQNYIGVPNGVVFCVDMVKEYMLEGRFYHAYSTEATEVSSLHDLCLKLERFFDELQYPYPGTDRRSFLDEKSKKEKPAEPWKEARLPGRTRVMNDDELLSKHGDLGTFILRVQHRQNSTWQGRITWVNENKTLQFRSVWELTKLIEEALDTVSEQED